MMNWRNSLLRLMKSHEFKNDISGRNVGNCCHQYKMGVWIFCCLNLTVYLGSYWILLASANCALLPEILKSAWTLPVVWQRYELCVPPNCEVWCQVWFTHTITSTHGISSYTYSLLSHYSLMYGAKLSSKLYIPSDSIYLKENAVHNLLGR